MAGKETRCRWRSAADLAVGCLPVTLSLGYRAAGQSLTGILANDPEEAVYLVNFTDDHSAKSREIRHELLAEHVLAGLEPGRTPQPGDVEQHAAADEAVLEASMP